MDALLTPIVIAALSRTQAIWAAVGLVLVVIIAWKFLKLAFKIALIVAVAVGIYFALRSAGVV